MSINHRSERKTYNDCCGSCGRTAARRGRFNRLLGGLVETVAVETVKAVASASLPGVLVLVFALQKGDVVRSDSNQVL
jgi:hypothetical protein